MVTVAIVGKLTSRSVQPWQTLCVAAWIVALIDPYAPQQLGTQLSFAATAGILAVVTKPKWLLVRIPIAAQISTLAWLALAFKKVPIFFLPLNIIASVVVTIVGVIIGLGNFTVLINQSVENKILKFGGLVVGKSILYLERIDSIAPLAMNINSTGNFLAASLVGVAWLLKDTIPSLMSRLISVSGVLFLLISLMS